ncbi:MAG: hypothetical protein KAR39_04810 [Thermoplasmata archaeon]|nr:hypothetical protein [Thermoplasmata archaeon]
MDESTVRHAATVSLLATFAFLPIVFYFMAVSYLEEAYAESAFLIGVSFVLIAQLVYYFERAFTPAEIWRTKDGFMVRLIGEKPAEDVSSSGQVEEPGEEASEKQ